MADTRPLMQKDTHDPHQPWSSNRADVPVLASRNLSADWLPRRQPKLKSLRPPGADQAPVPLRYGAGGTRRIRA